MKLTLLKLEQPSITAQAPPEGIPLHDIAGMSQLFHGLETASGQRVTPEKAMRCATVLACIRILTEDVSARPFLLYKDAQDGPSEAKNHPLYPILKTSPNDFLTSMELREHMMLDLMLSGKFVVFKNYDQHGVLTNLVPMQGRYLVRRTNQYVWDYSDGIISGTFTADQLWRGHILSNNAVDGRAITLLAREAIGLLMAADEQSARLFSNGVQTGLILKTAEELNPQQREDLKKTWYETYAGSRNAFRTVLLENGVDVSKIGLTAQESQFIESRNYQMTDIARAFRVPNILLGIQDKAPTYASAEQFFLSYVKFTLSPWFVRIEQTVSRDLLTPFERSRYYAEHNLDDLLRADISTRYAAYKNALDAGWLNPNEVRVKEKYKTVPGLDEYARGTTEVNDGQAAPPANGAPPNKQQSKLADHNAAAILKWEHRNLSKPTYRDNPVSYYGKLHLQLIDLMGLAPEDAGAYVNMRLNDPDRFSKESTEKAVKILKKLALGGVFHEKSN